MKALRLLLPLLVFAALAVLLWSGIGKDPHLVPSPLIDKPAPDFSLHGLHDPTQIVSKQGLLGKAYLLNVFGSWCVACQQEHQYLSEYAKHAPMPLIGLNWKDSHEDATRWLQQFGDPYSMIGVDADGRTAIDFGVYGAPESFLIDAQGIIRFKYVGVLTDEIIAQEIEPRIKKLQGGKP